MRPIHMIWFSRPFSRGPIEAWPEAADSPNPGNFREEGSVSCPMNDAAYAVGFLPRCYIGL